MAICIATIPIIPFLYMYHKHECDIIHYNIILLKIRKLLSAVKSEINWWQVFCIATYMLNKKTAWL